jgi:protein gp37
MGADSAIEWTNATWNPVTGCTKISAGCENCYAFTFAERWRGVRGHPYERGFDVQLRPERLTLPLEWERPRMIFVNSMSDLFHERIPDLYIRAVSEVMCASPWHTYQVLTKRSSRLCELLTSQLTKAASQRHVWWGVSIANKKYGLPRLEDLKRSSAAVRFLSIEPLLEDLGNIDLEGIHWVIVGGESGPGARPIRESWIVSIMEQCKTANVPFFFKQWGGVRKSRAGRSLQGRTYDEFPPSMPQRLPSRAERNVVSTRLAGEFGDLCESRKPVAQHALFQ